MYTRKSYWSTSKFADWVRGTQKLYAGTSKEWSVWRKQAKQAHPIRFWIVEEFFDYVQDTVNYPFDRLKDIRYYINNRWISRAHACTAHPKDIKPGEWQDVGNRFLPCLFNELVDFVEIEQAWSYVRWNKNELKNFDVPWYRRGWLRLRTWRSPEAGLKYLDWASNLVMNETWGVTSDDPEYCKPTPQALHAQEIKALYVWWKEIRPKRPDPYVVSGWNAIYQARYSEDYDLENEPEEPSQSSVDALQKLGEIEKMYDEEDDEMLIRLIKIRKALWT